MKKLIILLIIVAPIFAFGQEELLPGKTWKITEFNSIFRTFNIHIFHKDSSLNEFDLSGITFKFFEDGTYMKYLGDDSSDIGHWSLNNTHDSAYIDSLPFKLIQLDSANFITRSYSLQVADTLGTIDTVFTYFKLNVVPTPLPVSLLSFNGVFNDNAIQLQWRTAQEMNSHRFEILRSIDGKDFHAVGSVAAKGNSALISSYQYADLHFIPGINYYKLKMVDKDDSYSYSDVILVKTTETNRPFVKIYPNPARDQITMITRGSQDGNWQLVISNIYGQRVYNNSVLQNAQIRQMQLPELPKGIYFITITDNAGKRIYAEKLMLR